MNKSEYEAYFRKRVLLDKLAIPTETHPEAAAELDSMEKSTEDETQSSEPLPNH